MSIIGDNIRKLRIKNKWTQKELAYRINATSQMIWATERGRNNPTLYNLRKICEVFGCTIEEISSEKRLLKDIENEMLALNLIKPNKDVSS